MKITKLKHLGLKYSLILAITTLIASLVVLPNIYISIGIVGSNRNSDYKNISEDFINTSPEYKEFNGAPFANSFKNSLSKYELESKIKKNNNTTGIILEDRVAIRLENGETAYKSDSNKDISVLFKGDIVTIDTSKSYKYIFSPNNNQSNKSLYVNYNNGQKQGWVAEIFIKQN